MLKLELTITCQLCGAKMHVQRSVDKETSYEAYCPKCHDQIEGLQGCYLKYGFDGFDEFVNAIILKRLSDIMDKHLN